MEGLNPLEIGLQGAGLGEGEQVVAWHIVPTGIYGVAFLEDLYKEQLELMEAIWQI